MKKYLLTLSVFVSLLMNNHIANAQNTFPSTGAAGIGTTSPNASSLLEIKSTSKGFLAPRMTLAQRNAIVSPATGLLIYQTDNTPGFYYYAGSWKAMTPKAGWLLTGNAGTNPATNFIGTTDNKPLNFRVNNTNAGIIQTDGQVFIGLNSGSLSTGTNNTSTGGYALQSNTTGSYNTAIGNQTLDSNTTGSWNTAIGFRSLYSNKTGQLNTANGENALYSNIDGNYNTAMGMEALLYNADGSNNTAVGQDALFGNVTGNSNTAMGVEALELTTTGSGNTGVGNFAGPNDGGLSNTTALGEYASTTADNQVRIGNNEVTSIGGYVDWSNISDGRVKKNIKQNVPGLAFINKLQPITYTLDLNAADKIIQRPAVKDKDGKTIQPTQFESDARKAKEAIVYTGFVAQDIEKAAKSLNYDFSGVDAAKNSKDLYGLRYAAFVVPLVKAVQELSAKNDDLQKQIDDLKAMIASNSINNASLKTSTTFTGAALEQNNPNPFSNNTTIGYTLPQTFTAAQIILADKNGKTVKTVSVSGTGKNTITIDAATLAAGTYSYSLIVNGKLIGTKQMILAK